MKKYRLEVDNKWDSVKTAKSEEDAIKQLFPKAKKIEFDGIDDIDGPEFASYFVQDEKGEHYEVHVYEEKVMSKKIQNIIEKVINEDSSAKSFHVTIPHLEYMEQALSKEIGLKVVFDKAEYKSDRRSDQDPVFKVLQSKNLAGEMKPKMFESLVVKHDNSAIDGDTLLIIFDYRWEHFDRGSNGTKICQMTVDLKTGKVLKVHSVLK